MKKFLTLVSLLVGVAVDATPKSPQPGGDVLFVLKQKLNITSPVPHQVEAIMLHITLGPGDLGLKPHTHPGPVVGYVLEGELLQQVKGGPQTIVKAGESFYEKDGDVHVWSANASNDITTKVLVSVWKRPDEELTTYADLGYTRESRDEAIKLAQAQRKM